MPNSPILSYADAKQARNVFMRAWSKKWFNPLSWFRPHVGVGVGKPLSGTVEGWYVVIIVHDERHMRSIAKVAGRCLPGIPREIKLSDVPVAAAATKTPLV